MSGGRQIPSRKLGFRPDLGFGHLGRESTAKMPVAQDSHDGYLPKKETK
jgi:hypothetical protein